MSEAIFGFLGVIIGSIIPWIQNSLAKKESKKDDANYLGIKVVTILEKYILDCVDVVYDDGTYQGFPAGRDGCYQHKVETPAHVSFPDDINWKSIEPNLMFKLLSLPNMAHDADRTISFCLDLAGPPDYSEFFEERHKRYAEIGLYALSVEKELREKYKIPQKIYDNDWNPKEFFEKRLKELEDLEEKRQAHNQKFFESIEKNR